MDSVGWVSFRRDSFRRGLGRTARQAVMLGAAVAFMTFAFTNVASAEPPAFQAARHVSLAYGEVRLVDRPAGRIVLRHGPIQNLGIPPMTMIFRVKDPKQIDGLDSGAPVRFVADRLEGAFTIIHIERR